MWYLDGIWKPREPLQVLVEGKLTPSTHWISHAARECSQTKLDWSLLNVISSTSIPSRAKSEVSHNITWPENHCSLTDSKAMQIRLQCQSAPPLWNFEVAEYNATAVMLPAKTIALQFIPFQLGEAKNLEGEGNIMFMHIYQLQQQKGEGYDRCPRVILRCYIYNGTSVCQWELSTCKDDRRASAGGRITLRDMLFRTDFVHSFRLWQTLSRGKRSSETQWLYELKF